MFLKKFFRKDAASCVEKGEKLLAAGRYAEARSIFEDARQCIETDSPGSIGMATRIKAGMAEAGNRLAELNLDEADHCLRMGETIKAEEHLKLSLELAEDVTIREKTEKKLSLVRTSSDKPVHHKTLSSCGSCATSTCHSDETTDSYAEALHDEDRFELLIQPLPGDLPERYSNLGKEFANGYLAANAGNDDQARKIYERLLKEGENDIVLYELAILQHRQGDGAGCESLLRRAMGCNDANPLCHLGLVQLLVETRRFTEAIGLLERMVERQILPEQALLFQGDIYQELGDSTTALDRYAQLLPGPYQRDAAERIVPLLESVGRPEEAAYIAKQYLKGCC